MPRPLRIEYPGCFYHVLSKGNDGRAIFQIDRDYKRFLELLGEFCDRFEIDLWSYVLMGNHYHLLLKTMRGNLSAAMQWLGTAYSTWFNRRHERSGHLFQGRFKSFVVEEEDYLHRLILYVHRNPVRARLVDRLADYRWSSYRYLAYDAKSPPWVQRESVLHLFDDDVSVFREEVKEYSDEDDRLLENLWYGTLLGSLKGLGAFRRKAARLAENPQRHEKLLDLGRRPSIEESVRTIQRTMRISNARLVGLCRPLRGSERPDRDIMIAALCRTGRHTCAEIGKYFGIGASAAAHARHRGETALSSNRKLAKLAKLLNSTIPGQTPQR